MTGTNLGHRRWFQVKGLGWLSRSVGFPQLNEGYRTLFDPSVIRG